MIHVIATIEVNDGKRDAFLSEFHANVDNVLDNKFRAFIGAPELGRLAYVQLGLSF